MLALALALLWWTLAAVSAADVWQVLRQLQPREIVALLAVNSLILFTLCGRWWLFLYAQGHTLPFLRLVTYRLTAFGISYITPGPHFGGEPWQVYVVSRRHNVPYADSIAAVTLDKLVEMLVNFTFLAVGVLFILQQQIWSPADLVWLGTGQATGLDDQAAAGANPLPQTIFYVGFLLLLPLALLITYRRGNRPISTGLAWGAKMVRRVRMVGSSPTTHLDQMDQVGWWQTVYLSETQVIELCRRQVGILVAAFAISAVSWGGMVVEFWLMTTMLGLELGIAQAILAMLAARVAILLPMPAALGVLEASQALVMTGLGRAPADGIGLALLIRARDTLLAIAGIWIGGFGLWDILRGRTPHYPASVVPASLEAEEPGARDAPGKSLTPAKGTSPP
ncbi:MAG: lysylphosphatidylglycerol synthase transmembrane domain-containing protein [Litorilinea sp.]